MIIVAFLVGGVFGMLSAAATLLFTDLGWGVAFAVYFGAGYGLPLAMLAASRMAKPTRSSIPQAEMVRRS